MYNVCNSLTSKIAPDRFTYCKNQSKFKPAVLYLKIDLVLHLIHDRGVRSVYKFNLNLNIF